jgi:hypothetical protein
VTRMEISRGLLLGILMMIGSTAVYVTSVVHSIARATLPGASALDPENVIAASTIHSPAYWAMAVVFLSAGFVIVMFRLRPTP